MGQVAGLDAIARGKQGRIVRRQRRRSQRRVRPKSINMSRNILMRLLSLQVTQPPEARSPLIGREANYA